MDRPKWLRGWTWQTRVSFCSVLLGLALLTKTATSWLGTESLTIGIALVTLGLGSYFMDRFRTRPKA